MNCQQVAPCIAPLVDDELGPLRAFRVRRHLASCGRCRAEHAALVALRRTLRSDVPQYRAPQALVAALTARHGAPAKADTAHRPSRDRRVAWVSGALAGSAATIVVGLAATAIGDRLAGDAASQTLVAAHVRAVAADALVAVASSDRHRVKPWLSARLDYSPPVRDLVEAGYPLAGGRIDVVDGQRTAVLAYRYRDHTVDVFVRPAGSGLRPDRSRTIRGFNVVVATGAGMDWVAVSDANGPALADLLRRLTRPDDAAS